MTQRKPDAAQIEGFLDSLKQAPGLGPARQWWPQFLFFFAALPNAVRILQAGKLICRSRAPMVVDTGSPEVLNTTDEQWKDYVRLYFRPRTPTQYQIEGFRPKGQYDSLGKHMPVPIFFLFDAKDILTRRTTKFSDGSLAAHAQVREDALFFESIPFEKVYHDRAMNEQEKSNIKFHRHAEVMVPNEMDLSELKVISCRSEGEYQTLRHLLSPQLVREYGSIIRQNQHPNLHFCKWSFVERVMLEQTRISIEFNRSTITPGPFSAHLHIKDRRTGAQYEWQQQDFVAKDPLTINIPQFDKPSAYEVRFMLDENLSYAGKFTPKTIF